jgi:hypothetical protein
MDSELYMACARGNTSEARALIEERADPNCREPLTGMTPLHISCFQNVSALSILLIEKRADVNSVDYRGETALCIACDNDFTDIIPTLLREGADPFAGTGLFTVPESCVRLLSLHLARSGRCAACGTFLSLFLHSPSSCLSALHSPSC